jgi:endonuclease YncB( thermonuclease family)
MLRFLCALVALAFLPLPGVAETLTGHVVGVHDGDTITVLDASKTQYKVRLAAIDAPELKQAFGTRSRQSLAALVSDTDVAVEWTNHDRYKRIVGKVLVDDIDANCAFGSCLKSLDVGLQQIRDGFAWH